MNPEKKVRKGLCKDYPNCKRGDRCKFSHEKPSICRHFQKTNTCAYGGACKYSHDLPERREGNNTKEEEEKDEKPKKRFHWLTLPVNFDATLETPQYLEELERVNDENAIIRAIHQSKWMETFIEVCQEEAKIDGYPRHVSFQYVVIPFLRFCTKSAVIRSPLREEVRWLFQMMHESNLTHQDVPRFQSKILYCLEDLINRNCFQDKRFTTKVHPPPVDPTDVVRVIQRFFWEIFQRFSSDVGNEFYESVIDVLLSACTTHTPDLVGAVEKMQRIRGEFAWNLPPTRLKMEKRVVQARVPQSGGPGVLRKKGVRHDNDFVDFRKITILPTSGELACLEEEYIPQNRSNAYHHLRQDFDLIVVSDPGLVTDFQRIDDAYLLDLHFRLLRQDFLLPLKKSLQLMYENKVLLQRNRALGVNSISRALLGAHFSMPIGFKIFLNTNIRRKDWDEKHKKWFASGSMVVLEIDQEIKALAHVVSRRELVDETEEEPPHFFVCGLTAKENETLTLLSRENFARVQVRHVLDNLFAYRPVLNALQHCKRLPFSGALSSSVPPGKEILPGYVGTSSVFNLTSLLKTRQMDAEQELKQVPLNELKVMRHFEDLRVDANQLEAIVKCLTNEVSLIQGPPGTGKSYCGSILVRILLDSFPKVGPILCLCTTNHALDQFSGDLLDDPHGGKRLNLVRLGNRSKDLRMQKYSISELLKEKGTRQGSASAAKHRHDFKILKEETEALEKSKISWKSLQYFVATSMPRFWEAIEPASQETDEILTNRFVVKKQGRRDKLETWISLGQFVEERLPDFNLLVAMQTPPQELDLIDFDRLDEEQRMDFVRVVSFNVVDINFNDCAKLHGLLQQDRALETLQILRNADVVAATTSKIADVHDLIDSLKPQIVIFEEAGEVLEAHTLAALSSETQHLILIGDHFQLRPKPQYYDFSHESKREYDLDVSMFERLAKSKTVPMTVLCAQRRMRQEIADFTRITYPQLQDAAVDFPPVSGVATNVCFFHHVNAEDPGQNDERSITKCNSFEAEMVANFALYLCQQGYYKGRVVLLTPYVGQLLKIRQELSRKRLDVVLDINETDLGDMEELDPLHNKKKDSEQTSSAMSEVIRLATVDNFQGEEGDIVVLSTVRNNVSGSIGFVGIDNRINVMLSRARHGMFVFGNMTLLASKSSLWKNVIALAEARHQVSQFLPLNCRLHPETVTQASCGKDFDQVKDGGCNLRCGYRLDCGHSCPKNCHPENRLHRAIKCVANCERRCKNDHPCQSLCFEMCCCQEIVPPIVLPCGHTSVGLRCFHEKMIPCVEKIQVQLKCGHQSILHTCGTNTPDCRQVCSVQLPCGHVCKRPHLVCEAEKTHVCNEVCKKRSSCAHGCKLMCGHKEPCAKCTEPCETKCVHSKCSKKCFEVCAPCMESSCAWSCPHHKCTLPCGVPCERNVCNELCPLLLSCGHPCPSLCGEVCPNPLWACKLCASGWHRDQEVDFIENKTLCEVDEPLLTLQCGHSFTVTSLDGTVGLSKFYDQHGAPVPIEYGSVEYVSCPNCRKPLAGVNRYSRLLKRLDAERLSARFHTMVRQKNMIFGAEALRICNLNDRKAQEIKKRQDASRILVESIRKFQRKNQDPLRVSLEWSANAANMKIDTQWQDIQDAFVWACSWQPTSDGMETLIQERLQGQTSESVWIQYMKLAVALLSSNFNRSEKLLKVSEMFLVAFSPKTADGIEFRRVLQKMTEATSQKIKEEVMQIAMQGLSGVGWYGNGHRMLCPNNHFYVIGDCGGAMEESKCPDCGSLVGGRNHVLAEGNRNQ